MRSLFYKLIKRIADKRAVNALIPILKEEDEAARFYAALALGNLGRDHAVEALAESLNDKDYSVRHMAAKALVNIGSVSAFEALTNSLKSDNESTRETAAEYLVEFGDKLDITPLKFINCKNIEAVQRTAQKSLKNLKKS